MQSSNRAETESVDRFNREANLEARRNRTNKIILLFILFGGIFTFGMLSGVRGVTLTLIRAEYGADYTAQGTLLFITSFVNIAFTYGATFLLRRFGIKVSALANFAISAVFLAVIMFTNSFILVLAIYVIIYSCYHHYTVNKNALFQSIFTVKFALWMSILHAFFGLGSAAGPYVLSHLMNNLGFGWRQIYLTFSVPMAVFVLLTALSKFSYTSNSGQAADKQADGGGTFKLTVKDSLKMPIVWLYAFCCSVSGAVEYSFNNWAITYLKDVFEIDPITTGAMIMSAYFVIFTISRLISGFVMEKFGYIRMLVIFGIIELGLLIASFSLGASGIWLLPVVGFTVAPFFPAQLASMVKVFGRESAIMMGAASLITGAFSALTQYAMGWINTLAGPVWGFRVIAIFPLASIILHFIFGKKLAGRYGGQV